MKSGSDNFGQPGSGNSCSYRTVCYTVIGLCRVLITLAMLAGMVIGYLLVIGQDSGGRDLEISKNNKIYYQGALGQFRLARGIRFAGQDVEFGQD